MPTPEVRRVGLALLGAGVVGSGVAQVLATRGDDYRQRLGVDLHLCGVALRDASRDRAWLDGVPLTTDGRRLVTDPAVDVVIEVIGGSTVAYDLVHAALDAGKPVVTANKELIARHGAELHRLAAERGVALLYEASAGGGIPLIAPLRESLVANRILRLRAIINGTTNFILSRMAHEGQGFADALAEAQRLGYAEADPTNDVDGLDAAYKLAILASLAFGGFVDPDSIERRGIRDLEERDFRYAAELGYTIKLLAIAGVDEAGWHASVQPALVPNGQVLANVDGVFNAVALEGDLVGDVVFYGRGAGALPTASALIGDVLAIALGRAQPPHRGAGQPVQAAPSARPGRYYLRLIVRDEPGVLAQLARILGDTRISIASVIQKETDNAVQSAELVIMTHAAAPAAMQRALAAMAPLPVVDRVACALRIED